jgi:hypothetical protein
MVVMPRIAGDFDYVVHSGLNVQQTKPNFPKYFAELPTSFNRHPYLNLWGMDYLYDWLHSAAFRSLESELLSQTHTFIKIRFALVVCFAMANRLSDLVKIRA